jgi:endonuclease/exonuclease/phosphatase family metal-dependent hydrolase
MTIFFLTTETMIKSKIGGQGLFFSLVFLFLIFDSKFSVAQQRAGVVFWNVENLYDTIPSPFYDDREWTPRGANRWDTERYKTKIENLARVIDDIAADVVGLAEVENEAVVRDLVRELKTDYNYIHRTSADSRGIDLALLYKGDKFFPDTDAGPDTTTPAARLINSGTGREFLHVTGELMGERVHIVVCHMASNLNSTAWRRRNMTALREALETIQGDDPAALILTMGDMNATPADRLTKKTLGPVDSPWGFMYSPHTENQTARQGSYNYRGRWYLYDWMMASPALARGPRLKIAAAGVFANDYMTEGDPPVPRRTYGSGDYRGGFSDHFPVWMVIVK